jgi:hypothetical protein
MYIFYLRKLKRFYMKESIFRSFQRDIRANISYFFNKKENLDQTELKLTTLVSELANNSRPKAKNRKKATHKIFSQKIFNLVLQKNLINFLQKSFIQKMFFVHNRFFLLFYLFKLMYSGKWKTWKKILKESSVGNPVRYIFYPNSSGNKIFQTYHLKKFEDFCGKDIKEFDLIFEFGGGYGNLVNSFCQINKKVKCIIFDTFEVNLLQYYYLKKNNQNPSMKQLSYDNNILLLNSEKKLKENLEKVKLIRNKIFIANWSFSEVPISFRHDLNFIFDIFDFQLISFQKHFENMNNLQYFERIKNMNEKKNRTSSFVKVDCIKDNYYLFSKKN